MDDRIAFLYVIGTDDGPTKIGHSLAPEGRLREFQRRGREAILTGKWPVGSWVALSAERYVHWQLREHHIRSEWFNVLPERAVEEIQKALSKIDQLDGDNPIPALDPPGTELRYGEHIATKFPNGTIEAIAYVLAPNKNKAEFIRDAVERELKRREKK